MKLLNYLVYCANKKDYTKEWCSKTKMFKLFDNSRYSPVYTNQSTILKMFNEKEPLEKISDKNFKLYESIAKDLENTSFSTMMSLMSSYIPKVYISDLSAKFSRKYRTLIQDRFDHEHYHGAVFYKHDQGLFYETTGIQGLTLKVYFDIEENNCKYRYSSIYIHDPTKREQFNYLIPVADQLLIIAELAEELDRVIQKHKELAKQEFINSLEL